MFVVTATGLEGVTIHGPFKTEHLAAFWARKQFGDSTIKWETEPLWSPTDVELSNGDTVRVAA